MIEQTIDPACTVCGKNNLKTLLSLGRHPPSNRFLSDLDLVEDKHEMAMGYCQDCFTPQLTQRMPRQLVKPRFDWLKYNEPESHLDHVVDHLVQLSCLKKTDRLVGLSYKDLSTFDRLKKFNFSNTTCLSQEEFCITEPNPILDFKKLAQPARLILARHVIEHADSAVQLISQLKEYLDKDGYLVLEIPTNEKIFKNFHYSFIWEEHISYFTQESIGLIAAQVGAHVVWSKVYEYEFEDSLVFVLSFNSSEVTEIHRHSASSVELLQKFCQNFSTTKAKWQNSLNDLVSKEKVVALFGAGHLGVKLVNFFELAPFLDCVIDDHPQKNGLFMPGSRLAIRPSSEISERKINYFLSTLSPESELRVRQKMQSFLNAGGDFISAFNTTAIYA